MDGIGDVNGDGWDDLVVGAYWSNPGGRTRAGSTYIVFGGPGVGSTGMLLLGTLDGTNGFVIHGIDADDGSGWSVSGAGDVNGDGVHDVLIGAPDARPAGARSGEVYIVFGRNTAVDGAFSPTLELSSLDGENGVVLTGPRSDAWVGGALAALGDVNSDGVDDIGIGKRLNLPRPGANEAYVVYGRDAGADGPFPAVIALGSLDGVAGFKITCAARAGEIGGGFASAGDINHDGAPDFLVGAHLVDVGGLVDAGAVYIIYGRTGADAPFPASLHAPSLDGTDGFILPGYEASMAVGRAPTGGSDLNGDGVDDIALHIAPSAVVVYGRDAAADGAFPAVLDISTPDASRGVRITGVVPNDYAGLPEFAGDLNDDGFEDLVVRSPFQTSNGLAYAGEVYVLFGRERRLQMLCPADVDGDAVVDASDFVVVASHYGQHVTPGTDGDLNGDGVVDASDFVILAANFGCSE
jgi:hypothetical protein